MMKILINNEEVVSDSTLQIKEEMLSTSSTILKNCYPKSWEETKDYTSNFYFPKDYSKCKITDVEYYPPIIGTRVSGTNLNINYNNELKWDLEQLQGNTIQNGTPTPDSPVPIESVTGEQNINVCGKNLFDKENTQWYRNNGSAFSNITNTSTTRIRTNSFRIKGGETYTLSGIPNGITPLIVSQYEEYNGNRTSYVNFSNNTFTLSQNTKYINLMFSGENFTSETNTLMANANIQLEKGSSATEYEPYQGKDYEINLGKNLVNQDSFTMVKGTNRTVNVYFPKSIPAGTYTLSLVASDISELTSSIPMTIGLYGDSANQNLGKVYENGTYTRTFTTTYETNRLYFYISNSASDTATITINELMIEKGSQATSYSKYFEPIELCKIGNYKDRIYKQNDTWYIEKNIGKVVLDGSENWQRNDANEVFLLSNFVNYLTNGFIPYSNYYTGQNITQYSQLNNNSIAFLQSTRNNRLLIKNTNIPNTTNFKTWLSTHNTIVYYVLETPTYTEITDTNLIEQLNSIELLNGLNNISVSSAYLPASLQIYYNYREESTTEDLLFCGVVKNTGNINLNPREPHYVDLQVLDFKDLLSTGETLNFVINNKTITQAIQQVINAISDYGFVLGNVQVLNPNDLINAYSTLNKTAYDVFQYIADVTQSRWTTRMIDENTVAIDFYDPTLMPQGLEIESTNEFYCQNHIMDISFNYSTMDYRNKQIMTSDEVFSNITQTETLIADGYTKNFMCQNKIGYITKITVNGVNQTVATKSEAELGVTSDFVYQPGEMTFNSKNTLATGSVIVITYYAIVKGREIILNSSEISRIADQIDRKGVISRYENRNDTLTSNELIKIGQSYIKYKGSAEITLKIVSENELFNVGQIVKYNAPLEELTTDYMVKSKTIEMYLNANRVFYTYELSSNFNSENAVNYFDNQRAKNQGNLGQGETITRNIDLESTALIEFYDYSIEEVQIGTNTTLDFQLDSVL